MILLERVVDGRYGTFGTSGLLYWSNKLMFEVPEQYDRLPSKAEVLVPDTAGLQRPLAIAAFLDASPVYDIEAAALAL